MANTYNRINIAGGGSGANPPYVSTFVVGTWTGPSSGEYEINIPEATHSRGSDVQVDVFEKVGVNFEEAGVEVELSPLGDVTIRVNETPDGRFEGKIIIVGA